MSSGGTDEMDRLKNEVSRLRRSLNVLVKALVENQTIDAQIAGPITQLLREAESVPPMPSLADPPRRGSSPYRGAQPGVSEVPAGTELCARCGIPLSRDDTQIYVRDVGTVCTGCYRSYDGR
ncbi:MAG: hypothetical protein ABIP39_13200 [Polyangiaceae bacterium]